MNYIILCGGSYPKWETPRQLIKINNETIVERTIRLLTEAGISKEDIMISSNDPRFSNFDVQVIHHNNSFVSFQSGYWVDAFPQTNFPACYIFGDVVFSPAAIQTIVTTEVKDIEFFASSQALDKQYIKTWAEPFAFKVENFNHFYTSINKVKELHNQGAFKRHPIAWELWQVIKETPINQIVYDNYVAINDYTCDIDDEKDIKLMQEVIANNG